MFGQEIGERVKLRRDELGWSLRQLAARTEPRISHGQINRLENGLIPDPQINTVVSISNALGTSLDWLVFGREGEMPMLMMQEVETGRRFLRVLSLGLVAEAVDFLREWALLDTGDRGLVWDVCRVLIFRKKQKRLSSVLAARPILHEPPATYEAGESQSLAK